MATSGLRVRVHLTSRRHHDTAPPATIARTPAMPTLFIDILLGIIAAIWWIGALRNLLAVRRLQVLSDDLADNLDPPQVAVIIAARDEAEHIADTVQAFLDQQGVHMHLCVVDDRSEDRTGAIVDEIAASDERVTRQRIDELPDGWLGKCHALHVGAQRTSAEWLLFADADTRFVKPDVIRRAVNAAQLKEADHVCLFPRLLSIGVMARAISCLFFMGVADKIDRINRDRPRAYFGVGAFNLIRTTTYRAIGGHEPLKLEVLDDVHLGAMVRRHGGRSRFLVAFDDITSTWGGSVHNIIHVLEKNSFASIRYSVPLLALAILAFVILWGTAIAGPIIAITSGRWAALAVTAGLLANGLAVIPIARRMGSPAWVGAISPVFFPILMYAGVRSAALTLIRGGVRWRDTFYPLAELRAGRFR